MPAAAQDAAPANSRRSTTRTAAPRSASSKAIARPITPAPTTTTSPVRLTLHADVDRAFAALRRHPRNDLIGVRDVARLTVNAIRKVDLQPALEFAVRRLEHRLVHRCRTKVAARVAVLDRAAVAADVGVGDDQMTRLILF